ncbi:formate dehydrogenase accessory sulfurtransferase FdhD [Asticcacaulis solisilvae]|uniref:formate dehydrogenase accessory sulfurtransferase FdhD n=1 Tax=Asticcacaulis solisilvae TaxID=1217274 RepID=UPI003FD6C4C8
MPDTAIPVGNRVWRGEALDSMRDVPEETPVALVFDGSSEAVMMATPADLEDFVTGFAVTEGIVARAADIRRIEIVAQPNGIEARAWLVPGLGPERLARRRTRTGPTGCGLCGVESLEDAVRSVPRISAGLTLSPTDILTAVNRLEAAQPLSARTRAVHAAGFWTPGDGLVAAREDVGRHNALDKLAGALARQGDIRPGAVVLTSRVSVEMVEKTAFLGAPVLIAVSAPTALALRTADAAGLTVVAIARANGFEVFTHPERIIF